MKTSLVLISSVAALCATVLTSCGGASAQSNTFTLSSPDLASGVFASKFILNGFGCTGGNVSPEVQWFFPPVGTQSFSLQILDLDAPTGSGFWHWAVYNIPPTAGGSGTRGRQLGRHPSCACPWRQHRLVRHRPHGRQRQLRRSLPAGGRRAAPLRFHRVRTVGARRGNRGRHPGDRHRGAAQLRDEQGTGPGAAWQGKFHGDVQQVVVG